MKFFKWKVFIITSLVCLLPILLGLSLWNRLPEVLAIHFDVYGTPDNFASKGFVVFGLPAFMVILQFFCCVVSDLNAQKRGESNKPELFTKWMIPCLTVVLQMITLGYGLGWDLDIRKWVVFIVGVMFLVMGNYLPKLDYVKNYGIDKEKARKINRFIGYEMVVLGVLFIISIFLPPISSVVCLVLIIPITVIGVLYGVITGRK